MNSQKNSVIRCPQCGNACNKTETPLTHEHSIECRICGYQEINTIDSKETFKGYGSLVTDSISVIFHEPISFEKEQEILQSISNVTNALFVKYTDEHGLTVLKGELPLELTDEEEEHIKQVLSEEEYYNSIRY